MLNESQNNTIVEAIKEAETNTSGEIRVHIENKCKTEVLDRATEVFALLKMHKTALRNGVLFYIAIQDKKFAILGDVGINVKVEKEFWNHIKSEMQQDLKNGALEIALANGIKKAGLALKTHFPYQSDDINELSDEISFKNN